jgi:hypothetical protein
MIAYQEYNTKSPLNGLAAKWASQNPNLLPVDPRPIAPPVKETQAVPSSNEGRQSQPAPEKISSTMADPWSEKIVIPPPQSPNEGI